MLGLLVFFADATSFLYGRIKRNFESNSNAIDAKLNNEITYVDGYGIRRLTANNHRCYFSTVNNNFRIIDSVTKEVVYDRNEKIEIEKCNEIKRQEEKINKAIKEALINAKTENKIWTKVTVNSLKSTFKSIDYYVRTTDETVCVCDYNNNHGLKENNGCFMFDYIGFYDKFGYLYDNDITNYKRCSNKLHDILKVKGIRLNPDEFKDYLSNLLYERYIEMVKYNLNNLKNLNNFDYIKEHNVSINEISFEEYKETLFKRCESSYNNIDITKDLFCI